MTERDRILEQVLAAVPGLAGLLALAALAAALVYLRPILVGIKRLGSAVEGIVEDWHGTPERRDASGAIVQPGRPGMPARIQSIEEQLRVDYSVLRHDVTALTEGQQRMVEDLVAIAADFGTFKRRYQRDLERNHPGYVPSDDE